MKRGAKRDFPLDKIRRFLEPGPIVLVSSSYQDEHNIMALGWHTMLGFEPALVGCYIWNENHSFSLIRRSKECVINLPTFDQLDTVIGIGNCHGPTVNKFEKFGLTAAPAEQVSAPLIAECYANFECRLVDSRLIKKYSLFVFEVVKAHAATSPRYPQTVHYRGDGVFMISGRSISRRRQFRPENL